MENKTLEEIIALCKDKNEEAFTELYKRYYPQAYKLAYHISRSDADARDAAQETMISVYEHLDELQYPQYFLLWLKRIVVGSCNRIFRKNTHIEYVNDDNDIMKHSSDRVLDHDPIRKLHFNNDRELMKFFIALLPEPQEKVMTLFYFEQYSIKEIAAKLNISEGTVKSRLYAAKKKLREMISEYEKKEEIALDFQSDALFAMLGTTLLAKRYTKTLNGKKASFKVALVFSWSMLVLAGAMLGYQALTGGQASDIDNSPYTWESGNGQKQFSPVLLLNQTIYSAQDAYFSLMLLMDHTKNMDLLSNREKEDVKALYTSLKKYGGPYFELLQEQDWNKLNF